MWKRLFTRICCLYIHCDVVHNDSLWSSCLFFLFGGYIQKCLACVQYWHFFTRFIAFISRYKMLHCQCSIRPRYVFAAEFSAKTTTISLYTKTNEIFQKVNRFLLVVLLCPKCFRFYQCRFMVQKHHEQIYI